MGQAGIIALGACTPMGACPGPNPATLLVTDQIRVTLNLTAALREAERQWRPLAAALATMQLVETVAIILAFAIVSIHFMLNLLPNLLIILWMCLHRHLYTCQVGHLHLIAPLRDLPTATHL